MFWKVGSTCKYFEKNAKNQENRLSIVRRSKGNQKTRKSTLKFSRSNIKKNEAKKKVSQKNSCALVFLIRSDAGSNNRLHMDKKKDLTNGYNCVMLVTKQACDHELNCEQKNWDKF